MRVGRLTPTGIAKFADWLESLKQNGTLQPPHDLLSSSSSMEPLTSNIEVKKCVFANRYEVAKYLYDVFNTAKLTNIGYDRGLWAWLSLFYFDSVCPPSKGGVRSPGATARHIPELGNFQRYYRHLLAGPYLVYRGHRDNPRRVMAVLCQPVHAPGDVVEQLASRQQIITNRAVMEFASMLYVDKNNCLKRGAGSKTNGAARRLWDVLDQFDLTWDLYSTTVDELAAVIPREFEKFLK